MSESLLKIKPRNHKTYALQSYTGFRLQSESCRSCACWWTRYQLLLSSL